MNDKEIEILGNLAVTGILVFSSLIFIWVALSVWVSFG